MYKFPETSVQQKVGDELVILDLESGKYFGLDEVGARMVELLSEHGEVNAVAKMMAEEYDAPVEQIENDLKNLIEQLIEKKLLSQSE